MVFLPCCCCTGLLITLQLLAFTEGEGDCSKPHRVKHAVIKSGLEKDSYPVGTTLTYQCVQGYEHIPGIIPQIMCSVASEWLPESPRFCQGKKCPSPDLENGRIISSTDLRIGDRITFACDEGTHSLSRMGHAFMPPRLDVCLSATPSEPQVTSPNQERPQKVKIGGRGLLHPVPVPLRGFLRYRLVGQKTSRCTLAEGKIDWNRLPTCKRISCFSPPDIINGRKIGGHKASYGYGSEISYECDNGFSLIGNESLTCRAAENGVDGDWDSDLPECKEIKCPSPDIEHGSISSLHPSYTPGHSLTINCDDGYTLSGAGLIKCENDSNWHPSVPTCDVDQESITTTAAVTEPPARSLEDRLDDIEDKLDAVLRKVAESCP